MKLPLLRSRESKKKALLTIRRSGNDHSLLNVAYILPDLLKESSIFVHPFPLYLYTTSQEDGIMMNTCTDVPGMVCLLSGGTVVVKIFTTSHGEQAVRVAANILKYGLPDEIEDVFKMVERTDFGKGGMLGIMTAKDMLLRLDHTSRHEHYTDEQLDSTTFENYRKSFASLVHHPWVNDDVNIVIQEL